MSARRDDLLIEKLKSLPPEQRAEVEDFIHRTRQPQTGTLVVGAGMRVVADTNLIVSRLLAGQLLGRSRPRRLLTLSANSGHPR